MNFLKLFWPKNPPTAPAAKERLQIILAHERAGRSQPEYLPRLRKELLAVIARYTQVDDDKISVRYETSGTVSRLELNVELPTAERPAPQAVPEGAHA